jgi:hypothetical protein
MPATNGKLFLSELNSPIFNSLKILLMLLFP